MYRDAQYGSSYWKSSRGRSHGATIDLNLCSQVVSLRGIHQLMKSHSDIFHEMLLGSTTTKILMPNIINQPIFNPRKVMTSVSVWDGQTVVLGGLTREDVQKPKIAPLSSAIFCWLADFSAVTASNISKRNLVISATAHRLTCGQPINATEEEEETETVSQIEPPVLPQVPYYKK